MASRASLQSQAKENLADAKYLLADGRTKNATQLCGYALEFALKAYICKAHGWSSYPPGKKGDYSSFLTHDLETLLMISGAAPHIKLHMPVDWSLACKWDPQSRYEEDKPSDDEALDCLNSSTTIIDFLLQ